MCSRLCLHYGVMNIHEIMSQTGYAWECMTAFWWLCFPSYPVLATKALEYSWDDGVHHAFCVRVTDGHVFLHIRCLPRTCVSAGKLVVGRVGSIILWSLSWSLCWSISMAGWSQQCMHLTCYVDSQPHLGFQSMRLKRPFPISQVNYDPL